MNVYKFTPNKHYRGHIIVAAHNALEAVKIINTNSFLKVFMCMIIVNGKK